MTLAEILAAVRVRVNELSGDPGALLDDDGNLLGLVNEATEQAVLDLVDTYPNELLAYEDVDIEAGVKTYDLENEFWQILKIEKQVTGQSPTELEIIDPLAHQYAERKDETAAYPHAANIINGVLWVFPTPAQDLTGYVRVWGIQPEAVEMDEEGPARLPRVAHWMIVYWTVSLISMIIGAKPDKWQILYQNRLEKIKSMQKGKFQQGPRFVRDSVEERSTKDSRYSIFEDNEWP